MSEILQVIITSYLILGVFFGIIAACNTIMENFAKGRSKKWAFFWGIIVGFVIVFLWFPVMGIIVYRMLRNK